MTNIAKLHESIPKTRRGKRAASISDAQMVVAWLNSVKGGASRRVSELLAHLNRLDGLLVGEIKENSHNEWAGHQAAANAILVGTFSRHK